MVTVSQAPKEITDVATVDAAGNATITFTPFNIPWLVSQISTEMLTAPAGAVCLLRKRGALITPLIAAADVAAGDPPVLLHPGDSLTVEWSACTPGDQGKAIAIYERVEYG